MGVEKSPRKYQWESLKVLNLAGDVKKWGEKEICVVHSKYIIAEEGLTWRIKYLRNKFSYYT